MKLRIVDEFLFSRMTETDSGSGSSDKAKRPVVLKTHTSRITVEEIIKGFITLSGRKRSTLYSQLAFCDKNDEHVAPCWKTGGENLNGKTTAVLCTVLLSVALCYEKERSWCLNYGNCVERTIVDLMSVHG